MELIVDIKKKLGAFTLETKFNLKDKTLGLLGASGSGKSMTLKCIAGLETPDEGKIILNGKVFFDSEKKINLPSRDRKIGFLFQNYALFPHMTVYENIAFGLINLSKEEKCKVVKEKMKMMKLEELENRYPYQLSGGQQQRVALARALVVEPDIILLDEPFSALDDFLRNHMVKQFVDTLSDYKGVSIFVTHNMEEAYRICDDLIVLYKGKQEAYGEKEEVFRNPPTLAAAELTACKNVSKAQKLSERLVRALDWGIDIETEQKVSDDIKYIAIRANYISLAKEQDKVNVYKTFLSYTVEAPFRTTAFLKIDKKPEFKGDYELQWETLKEEWNIAKASDGTVSIHLNPNKLIMI